MIRVGLNRKRVRDPMATPREVGEAYWQAEVSRDVERILSYFHHDAVFHPVTGPLIGHDQIRTFYDGMGDEFPGLEVKVVRDITNGDQAALEWEAILINGSGERYPICGVNLVKVRDGKFEHVRAFYDPSTFPKPGK
jgi:limonene-1,2-epoxide hydrolase